MVNKFRSIHLGLNFENLKDEELFGPIPDALAMYNLMGDAFGLSKESRTILRDDIDNENFPTKKNFFNVVEKSFEICSDVNDIVLITIASHGVQSFTYEKKNKTESDGIDEMLVLYKENKKDLDYVIDDELYKLLNKSNCHVIIFVDTCNSKTIFDLPYSFEVSPSSNETNLRFLKQRENNKRMRNKNIYCISASRDDQLTAETFIKSYYNNHGLFSVSIINQLRDNNFNMNLLDLFHNVYVKFITEYSELNQVPAFTSSNIRPNFVLSNNNYKRYIEVIDKENDVLKKENIIIRYIYIENNDKIEKRNISINTENNSNNHCKKSFFNKRKSSRFCLNYN